MSIGGINTSNAGQAAPTGGTDASGGGGSPLSTMIPKLLNNPGITDMVKGLSPDMLGKIVDNPMVKQLVQNISPQEIQKLGQDPAVQGLLSQLSPDQIQQFTKNLRPDQLQALQGVPQVQAALQGGGQAGQTAPQAPAPQAT